MKRRLLAVDLSNQIYRACHAHDQLTFDGVFTGGLYGFMQSVSKAIDVTGATDLLVCRDMKPYVRSRDYPLYKLLRKTAQDPDMKAMYTETEPLVLELLRMLGVPLWGIPGFECDDLIAYLVRNYKHRFEMICAMCNDSDLFQLFDAECFRMYKDAKTPLTSRQTFLRTFGGITTDEFVLMSAMTGTHNDIEGVKGVGPATALKTMKDPAKMRQFRAIHERLIERNIGLIRLPHPEMPRQPVPLLQHKGRDDHTRALYRFCGQYGIQTAPWVTSAFDQVL